MKERLIRVVIALLTWVVPKRRGRWAFVSFHYSGKFSGNVAALFRHMSKSSTTETYGIDVEFVTNNEATLIHLHQQGLKAVQANFHWMLPLLRAEVIVIDAAPKFLGIGRFQIAQLWHGTGYKNIALSDNYAQYPALDKWLLHRLFKQSQFICATSIEDQERKQLAFNSSSVYVTGSPRNDELARHESRKIDRSQRTIAYAPTFRSATGPPPFSQEQWRILNSVLNETNSTLLIKAHPADQSLKIPQEFEAIRNVTAGIEDVQALLQKADLLITDYSGIASDFAITGRPMIFYMYDYTHYITTNRTFYYDLHELLPGPFAYQFMELLEFIRDSSWQNDSDWQKRYAKFQQRMHYFMDAASSERVSSRLLQLFGQFHHQRLD